MKTALKIVHVIVGLDTGGAERMLLRLIEELSDATHVVVSLTSVGTVGKELMRRGVLVIELKAEHRWRSIFLLSRLRRIFISERPHAVQAWMYHGNVFASLAALFTRIPVIWNIRNTQIPQGAFSITNAVMLSGAVLSWCLPRRVICCADSARSVHAARGYCGSKLEVIPNGYECHTFGRVESARAEIASELGFPATAFVVGVVARYDASKGYEYFIQAFSELLRSVPTAVAVCVGRGVNRENGALVSMLQANGLDKEIRLVGERADIRRMMSSFDVLCMPSVMEAFPNVVAEAMAAETPCVVTDVGDAAAIVGEFGYVVRSRDALAMSEALRVMASLSPCKLRDLGRRAKASIERRFSIESVAARYRTLYLNAARSAF